MGEKPTHHLLLKAVASDTFEEQVALLRGAWQEIGSSAFIGQVKNLLRDSPTPHQLETALHAISVAVQEEPASAALALEATAGLRAHPHDDIRWAAAQLLASTGNPAAAEALCEYGDDPDADVRWQVAFGLPLMLKKANNPSHPGLSTLLRLMEDSDDEVRDLATFGLGVGTDFDGADIREALHARLSDKGGDIAGEALVGLARRQDLSVLGLVRDRLIHEPDVGNLVVMAAEELGDRSLRAPLERLRDLGWKDSAYPDLLNRALARALANSRQAE